MLSILLLSTLFNAYQFKVIGKLKNNLIQLEGVNKKISEKSIPINLNYNKSTGELFANIPKNPEHTCVWTIWGDHGSEIKLTTDGAFIDNNTDPNIKINNFLPPRVPIYVTCVDWQNNSYYGSIGEYE